MNTKEKLIVDRFYWIRLNKGIRWEPAERVVTDYGDGWLLLAVDAHYYDKEVSEVGPEIIPPPMTWLEKEKNG